jgi:hypothetical protein
MIQAADRASQKDLDVEQRVKQRLLEGCPYAYYFQNIRCGFADGVLTLEGRVPTFYLKQVLQARLQDLQGVAEIHDEVDVVNASGLSSVRRR